MDEQAVAVQAVAFTAEDLVEPFATGQVENYPMHKNRAIELFWMLLNKPQVDIRTRCVKRDSDHVVINVYTDALRGEYIWYERGANPSEGWMAIRTREYDQHVISGLINLTTHEITQLTHRKPYNRADGTIN